MYIGVQSRGSWLCKTGKKISREINDSLTQWDMDQSGKHYGDVQALGLTLLLQELLKLILLFWAALFASAHTFELLWPLFKLDWR